MMKRAAAVVSALIASISAARAYDGEYVTHGGFDAVVEAFRYIALFFNHGEYGGLVFTFAAIGFAVGAVNAFFKANRDVTQFIVYAFAFVFGAGLFTAFVLPKGNINIYDATRNATAAVGGVPDGIVIVATLASNIQETAVAIADAAAPRLYEDTANGTIFDVARASLGAGDPYANQFLLESVKAYYLDCVSLATRIPASGLTVDELKNTSTDLVASFAKAQSDSNFTVLYSAASPGGMTASCREAWVTLSPQLSSAATYAAYENAICTGADFDAADAAQKGRCQILMDEIPAALFGQLAGDRLSYMRAAALAHAMEEAMADVNPERAIAAETNRRFAEQASGFFVIANQYGPFIRAAFLAAALATLPLLFLFLMTPFMGAVLRLFVGFFAFVALWAIIDIGIAQVAHGIAVDAFEDVARHEIAYSAFMLSPPASAKALAVFGATRFIAIAFAALFVVTVFKISGASFAGVTSPILGTATAAGDAAAGQVLNPVGRMSSAMAHANAAGTGDALAANEGGFGNIRDMNAGRVSQDIGRVLGAQSRSGPGAFPAMMRGAGVAAGAAEFGSLTGTAAAAGASPGDVMNGNANAFGAVAHASATRGHVETATNLSRAAMMSDLATGMAASDPGVTTDEILRRAGSHSAYRELAPLVAAGGNLDRAGPAAISQASSDLGTIEGRQFAANEAGYSLEKIGFAGGYMDETYKAGRDADTLRDYGAGSPETAMKRTAGRLDAERQFGRAEGAVDAAAYLGLSPGEASRQTESLNAERSMIGAGLQKQFAQNYGLQEGDFLAAQGGHFVLTPNDRVLNALRPHISETGFQMMNAQGGAVALDVDSDMNIQNVDVSSVDRASRDASLSMRGGERLHDAPMIDGDSLFNYALHDGNRGVAAFAAMASRAESAGQMDNFEDIVAREGANYLDGISGLNMSMSESGSGDARIAGYGDASAGTPGVGNALFGVSARAGVRVEGGATDAWQTSRTESINGYNAQIHDAFDATVRNDELGDMHARSQAFFGELQTLQENALDQNETVAERAAEPDGLLGAIADSFSMNKQSEPELSDAEFEELVRSTRFKQPGDM